MKIAVVAVGKAKGAVGEGIREYEACARRYFAFESHEVREEQYRGRGDVPSCATRRTLACTPGVHYREDGHCLIDTITVR